MQWIVVDLIEKRDVVNTEDAGEAGRAFEKLEMARLDCVIDGKRTHSAPAEAVAPVYVAMGRWEAR